MLIATDLQRQTLRLYGELLARSDVWGGKLVFTSGEGASATGLPAAVSIAGGTTLVLDPEAATVKAVFRNGGIDFVVNTLDEALRVLKNEIRQHKPLSVALIAPIEPTLAEMTERGVQPDLRWEVSSSQTAELTAWLASRSWFVYEFTSETPAALRALDARLLDTLTPDDSIRRAWLQRITHYQRPAANSQRLLWLTPAEAAQLVAGKPETGS
jgi:urocanate hydratase